MLKFDKPEDEVNYFKTQCDEMLKDLNKQLKDAKEHSEKSYLSHQILTVQNWKSQLSIDTRNPSVCLNAFKVFIQNKSNKTTIAANYMPTSSTRRQLKSKFKDKVGKHLKTAKTSQAIYKSMCNDTDMLQFDALLKNIVSRSKVEYEKDPNRNISKGEFHVIAKNLIKVFELDSVEDLNTFIKRVKSCENLDSDTKASINFALENIKLNFCSTHLNGIDTNLTDFSNIGYRFIKSNLDNIDKIDLNAIAAHCKYQAIIENAEHYSNGIEGVLMAEFKTVESLQAFKKELDEANISMPELAVNGGDGIIQKIDEIIINKHVTNTLAKIGEDPKSPIKGKDNIVIAGEFLKKHLTGDTKATPEALKTFCECNQLRLNILNEIHKESHYDMNSPIPPGYEALIKSELMEVLNTPGKQTQFMAEVNKAKQDMPGFKFDGFEAIYTELDNIRPENTFNVQMNKL